MACLSARRFRRRQGGGILRNLDLFPAMLLLASILSESHTTEAFVREIGHALGRILPQGPAKPFCNTSAGPSRPA